MHKNRLREYPLLCDAYRHSIRCVCKDRKITITEIAENVGLSRVMISYFLIGQKILSFGSVAKIANALGMTMEELAIYPYKQMCITEYEETKTTNKQNYDDTKSMEYSLC